MAHTFRCIPVRSTLRLATMPASGGAQRAYASGSAVSLRMALNESHALMLSAGAAVTLLATLDDGEVAALELDRGLTAVIFGRPVLSLAVTSSASGLAWAFEASTLEGYDGGTA